MKTMKTLTSLLLVLVMTFGMTACAAKPAVETEMENIPLTQDHMRTYYEIFPYSFADSNGDGVGDIQGIIDKLDYIDALHYDGLWLTPVHPSPTYHKYDVTDYYDIDRQLGTLEDYDRLIEECHKRGMTVLMDLVFNHSSNQHQWFLECAGANIRGREDSPYLNYYNFAPIEKGSILQPGWARFESFDWAYECQFWTGMPDLNLQNVLDDPDGPLAKELTEIMRFWLIDHDVDGFRLDAVTSYFSNNKDKNTAFLKWLNDTAKAIKPDCYIVGEGSWGSPMENLQYQSSGIDSFFAFQHGFNANGNLSYATRLGKAAYLYLIDEENVKVSGSGIPATFISNHDTGRAYGIAMGAVSQNNLKAIYGLMAMSYGAIYGYYGDEVGMAVVAAGGTEDSYKDEDKRQPMPWADAYRCTPVKGSTAAEDAQKYPLGTVEDQLADPDSLPNYIARANALRRAYPQIARSIAKSVFINFERDLCVVSKGEGNEKIYIVWNANAQKTLTFDTAELGITVKLGGTLSVDGIPTLSGTTLTMPAQAFAILEIEE